MSEDTMRNASEGPISGEEDMEGGGGGDGGGG